VPAPPQYPIRTERLLLRPYRLSDLDSLIDVRSREDVVRYLEWGVRSREEVIATLERRLDLTHLDEDRSDLALVIEHGETGAFLGDIVLVWTSREHHQGEIGWVVHPDHASRGYATEAGIAMLGLAFDHYGLHRICARLDARNAASARVCEKLGMRREGLLRETEWIKGEWTDEAVYALLRSEWDARA
jgi:RimJ/RimL family protein N-acetyltransferase